MSYSDYLDTHYSSCGMDDYAADKANEERANDCYDLGFDFYKEGKLEEADKYYKLALEAANNLDWGEEEYPPYKDALDLANSSYDEGWELFREGKLKEADEHYKKALIAANILGLDEKEYQPYKDVMDEIRRDSARRDPEDRHWDNLSTHNERFSYD